jgi:tetratricopeptide (TPR) repeat protein
MTLAKGRVSAQNLKRDPLMEQYINTSSWVKDRSRSILTWLTAVAVVGALVLIVWLIMSRRAANANESLATAFRYNDAIVQNPLPASLPPGSEAFTTEDEKHRKAYEAFEKAAREYPSYNGEIGRYFAATHQLYFEPEKAEGTLKELSQKDSEIGAQARLALAQRYAATGKFDEAIAEYQKLKSKLYNVPAALVDHNMAQIYEAQGKNKEAIDLYFGIANNKEWRTTALGNKAVDRLAILAPEKVDQLPPPEPSSPFGGMGGGMPMFQ